MKNTLFAWIGETDLRCADACGSNGLGPVCSAATELEFGELVLLTGYPASRTNPYVQWLASQTRAKITPITVDLGGDPTDYHGIYQNAKYQVQAYIDKASAATQLTFHLSPGTPQMATVWIILANTYFNAKLIQSSREKGVKSVDFPFEIAADYLPKLLKKNERKIATLFSEGPVAAEFKEIIHQSPVMKNLIHRAKLVAPYPVPVLIQGESGTGKELLAKAIHTASLRQGKFVAINCGAIPEDLFESELFGHKKGSFTGAVADKAGYIDEASQGTLFLDEIGEMPPRIQVKLLRVLQEEKYSRVGEQSERKTDIRIISATNRNLMEEIDVGAFREDLFHRLAVAVLYVPALREREGDLGLLIERLLAATNQKLSANQSFRPKKISAGAKALLLGHPWPGNVRELQNTLMRAVLWAEQETITQQDAAGAILHFPKQTQDSEQILHRALDENFDLDGIVGEVARHYLEKSLQQAGGNKSKAAKLLNFKSYQRLDIWLKKYSK